MALGDYRFIAAHVERERPAVGEPVARLGTVYHDGQGGGPRDRAGARSDGNAEDPHPVG